MAKIDVAARDAVLVVYGRLAALIETFFGGFQLARMFMGVVVTEHEVHEQFDDRLSFF